MKQSEIRLPPPVAPYGNAPLPAERIVVRMVFPVIGASSWAENYNQPRGTHRHTGQDIRAPKMRPVVAPFSGRFGFKAHSFWIYGDNGWRVLGTHLNDDTPGTNDGSDHWDYMFAPNLRAGDRVEAGQFLGYVGNSGDATGPHLHFELHGPEGIRNPVPSLRAARRIASPLPVLPDPRALPGPGEKRVEGCPRGFDPVRRVLTLQVVARQNPAGSIYVCTTPTRYRATLTPQQVEALGGVSGVGELPRDRCVSLYVREPKPFVGEVRRYAVREWRTPPGAFLVR